MNDNTTKLLRDLAQKMGTTTEYLWGVLIRQARIDAIIKLTELIIVLIIGVVLLLLFFRFNKKNPDDSGSLSNWFEKSEPLSVVFVICCIIWLLFFFVSLSTINDIFYGFLNPEYVALKNVMDFISQ
jgi:hypothetical protein